ncbi:MAG: YheU family protein [Pseudomonadales bacterium]|nr:YheU family protein [Pseudomonadales bacterium]
MKIPLETLTEAALAGIIESFVLREGTEYGPSEHDLERKCEQVRRQLRRGEAEIDFDPETDSVDIRPVSKNRRET